MWKRLKRRHEKRERAIFRYFNGRQPVAVDPLPVWREMFADPNRFDPKEDTVDADVGNWDRLIDFVVSEFGLHRFDPETQQGLTIEEIVGVFIAFCDFIAEVKKKPNMRRMLSPPTVLNSSPMNSSETTESGSGSYSTSQESSSGEPLDSSMPLSAE